MQHQQIMGSETELPAACEVDASQSDVQSELRSRSSTTTSPSSDSMSLNGFADNNGVDPSELEGISLLRQIFPHESTEELRQLHRRRVSINRDEQPSPSRRGSRSPPSNLRNRIAERMASNQALKVVVHVQDTLLPHDFLRLPPDVAVRRFEEGGACGSRWRYELVRDLMHRAVEQHEGFSGCTMDRRRVYSRSLFRDPHVGLGLSLCEHNGVVIVHSLTSRDGTALLTSPNASHQQARHGYGPATLAGIDPGDELLGVNGNSLVETKAPEESLVKHAVLTIRASEDPVVLHLLRHIPTNAQPSRHTSLSLRASSGLLGVPTSPSRLDGTDDLSSPSFTCGEGPVFHSTPAVSAASVTPLVHPFAAALRAHGLLQTYEEERECTLQVEQFTNRIRAWEDASMFRFGSDIDDAGVLIPLIGVRKALSVRILNSFLDGQQPAYCIWVHDAEADNEFFSPVRYFRDFQDLRSATARLSPVIAQLPFPKEPFSLFGSPVRQESMRDREVKCRALDAFLRSLCSLIYREQLHPEVAEIAIHVQSFLGYDNSTPTMNAEPETDEDESMSIRPALKRRLQMYTYRLFLTDGLSAAVRSFIDSVRDNCPQLEDLEELEARGRSALKARAMKDLGSIQSFLDFIQALILEGCEDDFRSIASRDEYASLFETISAAAPRDAVLLDSLVREAVREQVEIEVYVPLRGVASRWLVRGWRHEDMEVQFKIKELRRRPRPLQVPKGPIDQRGPDCWSTVSSILSEKVGRSTLPCVKLRAIVDAAREIIRLFALDRAAQGPDAGSEAPARESLLLGADVFLPIFICCVVQAEIERPCALCVLLRTLCDPMNRIGEVGYYLASFEATITHIQEVDLSAADDAEDVASFLSVPLNGSP